MSTTLFPPNPTHGMVFELNSGLFFKYDVTTRSWIKLTSSGVSISLATTSENGAMSSIDLKKLNRLVIPPPISSIIGTDCVAPFKTGNIGLYAGDKFVGVEGTVKVKNIGPTGELLSQDVPFHIGQHTYGFDFTIDFPELINELKLRKQFNVVGPKGVKGPKGKTGVQGPDYILTGQPGDPGQDGAAPPCDLAVEPDNLQVSPNEGLTKALVDGRIEFDSNDPTKYKLIFDRQSIGPVGYAADRLAVQNDESPWILAITGDQIDAPITSANAQMACNTNVGAGKPQSIYYIDVEPIINVIREKFLTEVNLVKTGYQHVVRFWVQTMSDLFDEQKASLCCALEKCLSIKKNQDTRDNLDSLAATAAGSANILLHSRNSKDAVHLSSSRLLSELGYPDPCKGSGPPQKFPQYPASAAGSGTGTGSGSGTGTGAAARLSLQAVEEPIKEALIVVDPLMNSTFGTSVQVPLAAGEYTAVINRADASVNNKHRSNVKIQHVKDGVIKSVQFLDKGEFHNLIDAKNAYEGLSLSFQHDGGMISVWLPNLMPQNTSGLIEILVRQFQATPVLPEFAVVSNTLKPEVQSVQEDLRPLDCQMSISHLAWYERGWNSNNCCGLVVNAAGQDWIIVKRSFGADEACGGGESENEPCIAKFLKTNGHVAFAWPTFDGQSFAPLPSGPFVNFHYDELLNKLIVQKISDGDFENGKGNPAGVRHLSYQFVSVLFPSA